MTSEAIKRLAILLLPAVLSLSCDSQKDQPKPKSEPAPPKAASESTRPQLVIERTEGPEVKTTLGYGIVLNKGSSLKREWFVVRDPDAPVQIDGLTGIRVRYNSGERYSSGNFEYNATYSIIPKEPVSAVEVRFVVFDVFGRLVRTLSSTEVEDAAAKKEFKAGWRVWSENEASEAFASVAYVAQVRTSAGRVYEANSAAVLEQVRKVSKRITEADLEPKRDAPTK